MSSFDLSLICACLALLIGFEINSNVILIQQMEQNKVRGRIRNYVDAPVLKLPWRQSCISLCHACVCVVCVLIFSAIILPSSFPTECGVMRGRGHTILSEICHVAVCEPMKYQQ